MLLQQNAKVRRNAEGTHTILEFPYNAELTESIRALPGRQWHAEKKVWTVPVAQEEVARTAIRPFYQIDGEPSYVEWKTVKMVVRAGQDGRHSYRHGVLIDGHDILNMQHGNLVKYNYMSDLLEERGGFLDSATDKTPFWKVEYHITIRMRKQAKIEAMRGSYVILSEEMDHGNIS